MTLYYFDQFKQTCTKSYKTLGPWVTPVSYPFVAAPVNAYILARFADYINPDNTHATNIYRAGLMIAFCAAVIQSMAMVYYTRKKKSESHPHDSICVEEGHAHGHGAENNHAHAHSSISHTLEHFFGLYLYNFAFGVGGIYYALYKDNPPKNTEELITAIFATFIGGAIMAHCEATIHETFLEHAHTKHGSIKNALHHHLIQSIRDEQIERTRVIKSLVSWGILLSHTFAGLMGFSSGIDALGLMFASTLPPIYVTLAIAGTLGLVGALVHTYSELDAWENGKGIIKTMQEILHVESKAMQFYMGSFIAACTILSAFHGLPEAIVLPELVTPEATQMLGRILISAPFICTLGFADLLTSFSLVSEAALKLFKENLNIQVDPHNETAPILPLTDNSINNESNVQGSCFNQVTSCFSRCKM
ncbi:MAG TPA: hypothetical protein VI522_03955 [Gammaproteobacteria bacterium]|nr:hypothetical protein [Gammaproteobacteria bacterium]